MLVVGRSASLSGLVKKSFHDSCGIDNEEDKLRIRGEVEKKNLSITREIPSTSPSNRELPNGDGAKKKQVLTIP